MEIATEIRNNTLPNGYIMMFIRRVVSLIQNKQLLYMINTYKECAMTEISAVVKHAWENHCQSTVSVCFNTRQKGTFEKLLMWCTSFYLILTLM